MTASQPLTRHGLDVDHDEDAEASVRYFMRTNPGLYDRADDAAPEPQAHQAPAASTPPAPHVAVARFGEASRQSEAARAAYRSGEQVGYRSGFISGMHWGMSTGVIASALIVAILAVAGNSLWPVVAGWFK